MDTDRIGQTREEFETLGEYVKKEKGGLLKMNWGFPNVVCHEAMPPNTLFCVPAPIARLLELADSPLLSGEQRARIYSEVLEHTRKNPRCYAMIKNLCP